MSGEFLNNEQYINKFPIGEYSEWTRGTLEDLLDVNGDGQVTNLEIDRAQSLGLINTLQSINPLVARAFNEENFLIQTGMYLTKEQRKNQEIFNQAIEQALIDNEEDKYKENIRFMHDDLNIDLQHQPIDGTDLQEDLKRRQYLDQAEINNGV